MGNLKRRIKQFSKLHNSQILKVQVVRVGWRCSYLIKYKKLESPIVCNPVNRRSDFEEWLRSIRLVKRSHVWGKDINVVSWRFYFYFGLKYYHGISGILTCIRGNRYYSEYECKCLNAILVVKFRNLNSIFFWDKEKIDITQVRKIMWATVWDYACSGYEYGIKKRW